MSPLLSASITPASEGFRKNLFTTKENTPKTPRVRLVRPMSDLTQANVVAVDYDPGASEVNQLNRIKLMIATALRGEEVADDFDDMSEEASGAGCGCGTSCGSGVQWNSEVQVSPAGRRSLQITPVSAAR